MTAFNVPAMPSIAVAGPRRTLASSPRLVIGCLCAAFLLSWVSPYHTYPFWSFYHDDISLIGLMVALLLYLGGKVGDRVIVPRTIWLPMGLAAVIVLDVAFGRIPMTADAAIPFGYLIGAAGAMVLGANLVSDACADVNPRRCSEWLATALVVAGITSALITFAQFLGVDDRLGDFSVAIGNDGIHAIRPYANLGQPNQLALILTWSLAGVWYLFQRSRSSGIFSSSIAAVLLTSIGLTQSKIGWLIVLVLLAGAWWASARPGMRPVSKLMLIGLALFFVAFVFILPVLAQWSGTVTEGFDKRQETNGVRFVMIMQGFRIGLDHPLLGVGWNQFGKYQVLIAPDFPDTQYALHSHNLVANLSAETGWPVTIAVLGSMTYWFYTRFFRQPIGAESLFVIAALLAVGIHSMVEFPLWYAYVLIPITFMVGIVEGSRQASKVSTVYRPGLIVLTVVCGIAATMISSDYRRLVQSFRALGYEKVGWVYDAGSTEEPKWTAFRPFYKYIAFASVRPTTQMTREQIAGYEEVAERFGYGPVLMRLATIYALNDRLPDALRTMDALRHLYPQRYKEAYKSWAQMAVDFPSVLGKVYENLPAPK